VKGNHVFLKNRIFPYDDTLSIKSFEQWMQELQSVRVIIPFHQCDELYYLIRNFLKHQTINRPSIQRNPEPPENILEDSRSTPGVLPEPSEKIPEDSVSAHGGLTSEREREREKKNNICAPGRSASHSYSVSFLTFYQKYPLKKSKQKAWLAWKRSKPDLEVCLKAIEAQGSEREKLKKAGQFCPEWKYPATWINQGCWEDEMVSTEAEDEREAFLRRHGAAE
jgi:hypothetical protein